MVGSGTGASFRTDSVLEAPITEISGFTRMSINEVPGCGTVWPRGQGAGLVSVSVKL